jgi:hypothetical protein
LLPQTINIRLAAIRRLTYEAAGTGLLSPELVAGIRRVKGVTATRPARWELAKPCRGRTPPLGYGILSLPRRAVLTRNQSEPQ